MKAQPTLTHLPHRVQALEDEIYEMQHQSAELAKLALLQAQARACRARRAQQKKRPAAAVAAPAKDRWPTVLLFLRSRAEKEAAGLPLPATGFNFGPWSEPYLPRMPATYEVRRQSKDGDFQGLTHHRDI